jgi:hypothetical protein
MTSAEAFEETLIKNNIARPAMIGSPSAAAAKKTALFVKNGPSLLSLYQDGHLDSFH